MTEEETSTVGYRRDRTGPAVPRDSRVARLRLEGLETPVLLTDRPSTRTLWERLFGRRE